MYRLYIWTERKAMGCGVFIAQRGKCIAEFKRYKQLVAEAQRRAVAAGYPKSRWMDLYDWSHG